MYTILCDEYCIYNIFVKKKCYAFSFNIFRTYLVYSALSHKILNILLDLSNILFFPPKFFYHHVRLCLRMHALCLWREGCLVDAVM